MKRSSQSRHLRRRKPHPELRPQEPPVTGWESHSVKCGQHLGIPLLKVRSAGGNEVAKSAVVWLGRNRKKYHTVFVGDVSGKFVQSGNGKSSTDASIGVIRDLLKYKAMRHSGNCYEVNENSSTATCSACHNKTGPSGLSGLGVREWTCSECHAHHDDRDINASKNILRFGRESLRAA